MDSGIGSDIVCGEVWYELFLCWSFGGGKRNETWEVGRRDKAKCLAHEGYPAVIQNNTSPQIRRRMERREDRSVALEQTERQGLGNLPAAGKNSARRRVRLTGHVTLDCGNLDFKPHTILWREPAKTERAMQFWWS